MVNSLPISMAKVNPSSNMPVADGRCVERKIELTRIPP